MLLSLCTTLYLVLRDPWVQTISVRVISHYFSVQLHTEFLIGGLDVSLTHGLTIDDIVIKDKHRADLFSARKLSVVPGRFSLSKKILILRKVYIENGIVQLLTHRGDTVLNLQFIIDYLSSPTPPKAAPAKKSKPWHLAVSTVEILSTRFHLQDENKPPVTVGMDYSNIDVKNINLLIKDFRPDGDTMKAGIVYLSANERSGLSVLSMSGDFQVSPKFLKARNLKLETNHCKLDLSFEFNYDHWTAYNDFLNKVHIKAVIRPTYLDLQDVGTFAPELYIMKNSFKIEGKIKGTVNNFNAKEFKVAYGSNTRFHGNIHAFGLPNVEETFVDLDIRDFTTSRQDIQSLNLPIEGKNLQIPDFLRNAGVFNLKGTFTGFYNDFVATASLGTNIGSLKTDLTLRKQKGVKGLFYKGEADVTGLQLGELFKSKQMPPDLLGPMTLRADLNGRGFNPADAVVSMNIWIDSITLKQYTYHHLALQGDFRDEKFNGKMNVDDDNLNLHFNGLVDMSDSLPKFDFDLNLHKARLFEMNLLKRDSLDNIAAHVRVDITGNSIDNVEGIINVDSTRYDEGKHSVAMRNLSLLTSRDASNNKSYHLKSDFVDADVTGNFYFSDLIPSLSAFVDNYLASFHLKKSAINHHPSTNQQIKYTVRLKNPDTIMAIFMPALKLAPDSHFEGSYNEDEGTISLSGFSDELAFKGIHFANWYLRATSTVDNLKIQTGSGKFFVPRGPASDSSLVLMDSIHLTSNLHHDSILYDVNWNKGKMQSELGGYVNLREEHQTKISLTKFHTFIDKKYWTLSKDNEIVIDSSSVLLHNLTFEADSQKLSVEGRISSRPQDTLLLGFNKVNISDVDLLTGNNNFDVDGILSGDLKLMSIPRSMTLLSNVSIAKLSFNKELLGDGQFKVFYDDNAERFDVDSKILYTGNAGTNVPLSLQGSYYLGKNPRLKFDLALKNLNLKMVAPFVSGFMSRLSGLVSGHVTLEGPVSRPRIGGQVSLMRTEFKINYLNVIYSLVDVVDIDSTAFIFNHVTVLDSLGNKAIVNGRIYHNFFQGIDLDLTVEPQDFSAFHNTYAQNNIFYGTARGTGSVNIKGPPDNIQIGARVETGGGTHVNIPISSAADVGQNDYIIFKKPVNDSLWKPESTVKASGIALALALKVNPSADVEVSLPNQVGNIKANGSGNLTMGMTPTSGFTLSGSYVIQRGNFHFQIKNLVNLGFTISDGSKITWSGDPSEAKVGITAIYKTRVPLGDIATSEEDKAKRISVECIIRLSGELSNPDISFGMNLPNSDESLKTQVFAAIDTVSQVEMTQQIFNILVFDQFKSYKGNAPGAIDVGSTSMGLVMNQVNSLLSQLSKNVDIGFNYHPSTTTTGQEIDVAVSTQLFNERLLIDGLFGVNSMNPNTTAQKASTIVGDIKVEYILTDSRRWRVRAFNRTNTVDLLYNNAPYTQGVGLSYQRDFNRLSDFLKKDKSKK